MSYEVQFLVPLIPGFECIGGSCYHTEEASVLTFPEMCVFGTGFTTVRSLIQVGMLAQLLTGLWAVLHRVRETNTYGLSRMSCTPKHLLSSLFIFLLNLHYLYMESPRSSLLSKKTTPGSKPQRRVWAVFLGCLWRPHDRVVLSDIRHRPKGKNELQGSIRIEENIGHKPLVVTDVVNSTCSASIQKCSFVQGRLLLVVVLACTNVSWRHNFQRKNWDHLTAGISQWCDLCADMLASVWYSCWDLFLHQNYSWSSGFCVDFSIRCSLMLSEVENYFPVFWKEDTETSASKPMYYIAFSRFP